MNDRLPPLSRPSLVAALALVLITSSAFAGGHDHSPRREPGGPEVPMFHGVAANHRISTKSQAAQRLFDQGLGLCFAFNHDEAIRSFEAAAELDSTAAMPWWGVALALGPNINMAMSAEAEGRARVAIAEAKARLKRASKSERDYVAALAVRYGSPAGESRAARDSAYANAMRALVQRYPDDMDAAVLCAEALMDLRPWDLWTVGGDPKAGTVEIVDRLEAVLRKAPDHIGALHLYIHSIEASSHPERAEAAADRLRNLSPEAGHLIHMPTHIYLRVGRYAEGALENRRAMSVDSAYIARWKVEGLYPMMYANHNIHMRWSALCAEGRSADAIAMGRRLADSAPAELVRQMQPMELFSAARYLTLPRFGRWEAILTEGGPPTDLRLTNAVWRLARGLAYAATGHFAEASVERDSLAAIAASCEGLYLGLASGPSVTRFALKFLEGEISARKGRTDEAVSLLSEAAGLQDSLQYDEPPQFNVTARQSLGAVLLSAGRAAEAEAVYRKDLERYRENGWALRGLADALRAQGKGADADLAEARFKKAWANADVPLTSSRF